MDLWNELFKMQEAQGKQRKKARVVLQAEDTPWEINRQGKMKWYLHPAVKDTCHQAFMAYVQEIPPGSRSGKIRHQGGTTFYVWQGKGYSMINGKKHIWEKDDTIILPVSIDYVQGVTYQHFNSDKKNPALLLAIAPNVVDSIGVDMGIGLQQLEDCPEYRGKK